MTFVAQQTTGIFQDPPFATAPMPVPTRGSVLDEAKTIINGERQNVYGNPEDSFEVIAEMWNAYIKGKFPNVELQLNAKDTALMMVLFKIARETHQGKRDNLIDAAGYIGIAGDF
jgi:hypothetical protein